MEVLKDGMPDEESKPSAPEGEAGVVSSLLVVCYHVGGGVYEKVMSHPLLHSSM